MPERLSLLSLSERTLAARQKKKEADMVEMLLQDERVERLRSLQVGEEWIRMIVEGKPEQLESFCQPAVVSQILTPRRYLNLENAADLAARFRQWFGNYREIQVEESRVELVGERLGIFYRFLLREPEGWSMIAQQLFCTMQEGRVANLHLVCSGFQAVALGEQAEGKPSQERDALLEMHSGQAANGSTCSLLTPAIKAKLREMQSGQVLEVHVDDPSAREDIEAWCRLSGNLLLKMDEDGGAELRFFVQKK
jgi:TusA-related sulfurtransferase